MTDPEVLFETGVGQAKPRTNNMPERLLTPSSTKDERPSVQDVFDVKVVDWNHVWQVRHAARSARKRDARFWDGRAASFVKAAADDGYADQFIAIMRPEPHWTVLDMGCGGGAVSVPLAKSVSSITAVDHSREMLALLQVLCEDQGLHNVRTKLGRWEDDWGELGIGTHEVALASRSMVPDNLRASVLKLHRAARKRVYIATIAGDGPYDRRLFDAIGRPLDVGPDYIYNYNMLYQMGIFANVAFIEERRNKAYGSPEEAFASIRRAFDDLSEEEEERLRAYVTDHLESRDGRWSLSYDNVIRWAVLWWDK